MLQPNLFSYYKPVAMNTSCYGLTHPHIINMPLWTPHAQPNPFPSAEVASCNATSPRGHVTFSSMQNTKRWVFCRDIIFPNECKMSESTNTETPVKIQSYGQLLSPHLTTSKIKYNWPPDNVSLIKWGPWLWGVSSWYRLTSLKWYGKKLESDSLGQ